MIFDRIEKLEIYKDADIHFEAIIAFLKENNFMKDMECGSYAVGNGVNVSIAEYEPATGGDYEAHRNFHDLQYAIIGGETIEVVPTEWAKNSKGYKPDIEFFSDKSCNATSVALDEGTFVYLTPGDAHKPCVKSSYSKIKKAVFKIPVE